MSTARGNAYRNRPQKHQNRTVFKNDLHDSSQKTKLLNSLQVTGVCKRCKDILDWKIKYKKYKPLTAPRKCVGCDQKTVKHAYHMLCKPCAKEKNVCAKCCKKPEVSEVSLTITVSLHVHAQNRCMPLPCSIFWFVPIIHIPVTGLRHIYFFCDLGLLPSVSSL